MPFNLAGSQTLNLLAGRSDDAGDPHAAQLPADESIQGMLDVDGWAKAHPDRSIVLVIVESLGVPAHLEFRRWIDGHMNDATIGRTYSIYTAELSFQGATIPGELRALCGIRGDYRKLGPQEGSECLPSRLARMGWHTIGLHGFTERIFDRHRWWAAVGLRETRFAESTTFANSRRCGGAFRGVCDDELVLEAFRLAKTAPRFVYALTLNTHLPLPPVDVPTELQAICQRHGATQEACDLLAALGTTLKAVRSGLADAERPPLVLLVGDHAPPFAKHASRKAFLAGKVPAYVFVPGDDEQPSAQSGAQNRP